MTQYNALNVKLFNSQLNKLKSEMKNGTLKLSSNVVGDTTDETNFSHKLLLTNTQVLKIPKAFAINSSANIKLLQAQFSKIGQSVGFLGRLLLKTDLPLTQNVLKPLAKRVLIPIGLTIAESATDAAIPKIFLVWYDNINNFKWRNGRYYKDN